MFCSDFLNDRMRYGITMARQRLFNTDIFMILNEAFQLAKVKLRLRSEENGRESIIFNEVFVFNLY